jgi:hypothetical protein
MHKHVLLLECDADLKDAKRKKEKARDQHTQKDSLKNFNK